MNYVKVKQRICNILRCTALSETRKHIIILQQPYNVCQRDGIVHIVSKEIYLGNYISENIYDRAIKQTVCAFNAKSNQIISDFSMLDCFSLHKLHTTYCMSLYGCEIWNYNVDTLLKCL